MYRRKFAYIAAMLLSAALLFGTGCVRDDVDEGGGEYPEFGPEDYALAIDFDLGLFPSDNGGGSTRSDIGRITRVNFHPEVSDHEYWENHIDLFKEMRTYSGDTYSLHVLLFDENNNFLFNPQGEIEGGVTNPFYVSQTATVNGEYKRWRVVFQAPKEVREYVSNHKFKVAVFANWPTNPVANPYYTRPDGKPEYPMPVEFWSGEPWGGRKDNPISIRSLVRSVWDSTYGGSFSDIYYILTDMVQGSPKPYDGSHMGPFTQWVLSYHPSEDDAVSFIRGFKADALGHDREYYEKEWASDAKSDRVVTPRVFRRNFDTEFSTDDRIFIYQNLWNLWNFGGLYNADIDGQTATAENENTTLKDDNQNWQSRKLSSNNDVGKGLGLDNMYYGRPSYIGVWASRNHRRAVHSLGVAADGTTPLVEYIGENGGEQEIITETGGSFDFISEEPIDEILNYKFEPVLPTVAGGALEYNKASQNAKLGKDENGVYLKLPKASGAPVDSNEATYKKYDHLHFKVFANSVLYIKTDDVKNLQIESNAYEFAKKYYNGETEEGNNTWFLDIRTDAKDVWIMSKNGEAKIYEIELIQKKYLYDSDRRTMLPSEHQLIPMYGIQEYEPLGDYWVPGYVFDLSHDNGFHRPGYDYRTIYLLRSVSRVEVLVSKEFKDKAMSEHGRYLPRLVMRSMNRFARCMPLDVATPTNEIWDQVDQEILNIREHGPFYTTAYSGDLEKEAFRNRLAWFYSRWVSLWNWDWNGWRPDPAFDEKASLEPPMVYNAKISRSDYVRLIKVDDNYEGMYERYILYMPEKAIDDATDAGELSGTPKVPHIEVRLKGEPVENLDDNKHDRIYFMDYAATGGPTNLGKSTEYESDGTPWEVKTYDNYEKNADNLRKHWPVVRNHIYRFRVHPSSTENVVNVTLDVANAAGRSVTIPDFD